MTTTTLHGLDRLWTVARLLTEPEVPPLPVRPHNLARILGVPLEQRGALLAWIESTVGWVEPPTSGPLHDRPLAGCVSLAQVAKTLRRARAKDQRLPFVALGFIGLGASGP